MIKLIIQKEQICSIISMKEKPPEFSYLKIWLP